MEIESELCFFLYRYLQQLQLQPHPMLPSPPSMAQAKIDASALFLRVYCSLWASPVPSIITAAGIVLAQKLNSSLTHTAAHKRAMEGGCNKVMSVVTTASDFDPVELPLELDMWKRVGRGFHPLCEMPAQLVLAACNMHYNTSSIIKSTSSNCDSGVRGLFVAFDGRGDITDYRAVGAVFSSDVDYSVEMATPNTENNKMLHTFPSTHDPNKIDKKFVDMFLAMHSAFFVLNPRSTFSWEIYIIRLALSLPSVPVMRGKDLYVLHPDDYHKQNITQLWVSWLSAKEAMKNLG